MPIFSQTSKDRLYTCHPVLITLCNELITYIDFMVVCGYRNQAEQEEAFNNGFSKLHWPYGRHNKVPSLAVDIAPYPLNWDDVDRFKQLGFFVLGYAAAKGINITWGADWNKNYIISDERFIDLPHVQLEIDNINAIRITEICSI